MLHKELTEKMIQAYYRVYNELGYGFLEKVYERALELELSATGLEVKSQYPIQVFYRGEHIGDYIADLLVEDKVIVEIKAADCLIDVHEAQLLNYLKATNIEVGLLMNFGPEPKFFRRIFTNDNKLKRGQPASKSV